MVNVRIIVVPRALEFVLLELLVHKIETNIDI